MAIVEIGEVVLDRPTVFDAEKLIDKYEFRATDEARKMFE